MMDDIDHLKRELATSRRNVYRLQQGGDRLCEALRQIVTLGGPAADIASRALAHRAKDPDWAKEGLSDG